MGMRRKRARAMACRVGGGPFGYGVRQNPGPTSRAALSRPLNDTHPRGLAHVLRHEVSLPSVYTLGLARGGCAPFEPPASRAAAGSTGRPGAQPPDPRTGVRGTQRRTAVVAADLTPVEQVAVGQAAEALRLPNAGERASEDISGAEAAEKRPRVRRSRNAKRPRTVRGLARSGPAERTWRR